MDKLVEIKNLVTRFKIGNNWAKAVRGVDLDIYEGETLGIVGESGSGKSVSVLSLIQLIPNPPGEISDGEIIFKNQKIYDGKEYNNLKSLPKFSYFENLTGYLRGVVSLFSLAILTYIISFFGLSILPNVILFFVSSYLITKIFYSSPFKKGLREWQHKFFKNMKNLRGDEIAMIFQEPMTSLNPVFTIGFQIMESIKPLTLLEYFQNGVKNRYESISKNSLKDYQKPSIIFGIIFVLINQLLNAWTFQILDIFISFGIGGILPILLSEIIHLLYKFIPQSKIQELDDIFNEGVKLLEMVGIPDPHLRMADYPHQYSGGMRQRAMIAMALAKKPSLLIADEPTTALDVTIQAQILNLMSDLKNNNPKSAVVLITHDLAVVAESCERVVVMYGGMVQEIASVEELFENPLHPYTHGLLKSIPNPSKSNTNTRLDIIDGMVPNILNMPEGCKFCTRCELKEDICETTEPPLVDIGNNHFIRCHVVQSSGSEA